MCIIYTVKKRYAYIIIIQENGAKVTIKGTETTIYGTIATVCADNPGSTALGGFKESGSAHRLCRHCLITNDELKAVVSKHMTSMYTVTIHSL